MNSNAMEKSGRKRNHSKKTSTPLRSLNATSANIKRQKSHNQANEAILADEVQKEKKNETAIITWANDRKSNEENIMSAAEVTTKHATTLQPVEQAAAKPLAKPSIKKYKLQGVQCQNTLQDLEKATKECADTLIKNGFVTNPKSHLHSEINWDQFYDQNYPNPAVYQKADGKIGGTTFYAQRLDNYRKDGVDTNSINIMIKSDALTKAACEKVEKSRKDYFTGIGVSAEEPKSLQDLRNNPYFHHDLLSHFSEERGHTYYLKMLDTLWMESCMQFKFGLGNHATSMHEWIPADVNTFWKNYEECVEIVQGLCKLIHDTTGRHISEYTILVTLLSWKPGKYTGDPDKKMYSKTTIAQTFLVQFFNAFPDGTIPESDDIEQCYNTDYLQDHRAAAQKVCIAVAKETMNSPTPSLRMVDTNNHAWTWDDEEKKNVPAGDRHLQVYLSLDYDIKYQDEDIIILYTSKSQSFVFLLGPLCKILSLHTFKGEASTTTATKRAFWAEAYRQLCNMANQIDDGGKDNIFGNIWLMYFLTTTLKNQLHADSRWCDLFGKDLLTSRDIYATSSEYTNLPKRTRNTLSNRCRTDSKSEDRDGASSGHYEKNIFEQACDLLTCSDTLEDGMEKVFNHFTNTGSNLQQATIYWRCEEFGRKEYLSEKLRNAWIIFFKSKRTNRGNVNARGLTSQQRACYDNSFEGLVSKAEEKLEEIPDDDDVVEFKVWLKLSSKEKKKATEQNSELNQPNWRLEDHLQLPFVFETLQRKVRNDNTSESFDLRLRQYENPQKKDRPYVTRNNYKYKLATIVVSRKE